MLDRKGILVIELLGLGKPQQRLGIFLIGSIGSGIIVNNFGKIANSCRMVFQSAIGIAYRFVAFCDILLSRLRIKTGVKIHNLDKIFYRLFKFFVEEITGSRQIHHIGIPLALPFRLFAQSGCRSIIIGCGYPVFNYTEILGISLMSYGFRCRIAGQSESLEIPLLGSCVVAGITINLGTFQHALQIFTRFCKLMLVMLLRKSHDARNVLRVVHLHIDRSQILQNKLIQLPELLHLGQCQLPVFGGVGIVVGHIIKPPEIDSIHAIIWVL